MPDWRDDPLEQAIREFCYGAGRAIPRSVFLGRVVEPGEALWLEADWVAALEWRTYEKSLCSCGRPRTESFDKAMDDRYEVTPLVCNACAARDRKAWNRSRDNDGRPLFGEFYIVKPEEPDVAEAG